MRNKIKSLGKWLSWKENPGPPLPLLVILYAGILIMVLMSVLPALGNPYSTMPVNKLIAALGQYGYVAFASPQGELTVTGDILPSSDCGSSLGSATLRFQKGWFCSSSVYIGEVELSNTGSQLDIDGQLVMHGAGKVWMEVQPDLDFTSVLAQGKPTWVRVGTITGFSLPVGGAYEELWVNLHVPRMWDGVTNPVVHIQVYLPEANNNKRFKLAVSWDKVCAHYNEVVSNDDVIILYEEVICNAYSPAGTSYSVDIELDYDANPSNPLASCNLLGLRIARVASSQDEILGEVVIMHTGVQFLRDKLGEVTP